MITTILPQDPPQKWQHWQLPEQASTFAHDHDSLYQFVEWINYIFFFGIMFVLFYAVVKYRRKTPDQPPASEITHHTVLEVTWTVVPLIVVMIIFALGWRGYADMTLAPADALQYEVKAKRWAWSFKHPGSTDFVTRDLWVPVDTPVQLTMSSSDVLHSFFIPAFRVKRDVLPGRYQTIWFKATRTTWDEQKKADEQVGFHLFCTEFCGQGHAQMVGNVHVVSKELWARFQAPGADVPWNPFLPTDPDFLDAETAKKNREINGAIVYRSCMQCHTLDGTPSSGPSFKGLWARNLKRLGLEGNSAEEQEEGMTEYITKSIRDPNAYIAEGFSSPSAMTPFSESALKDERVYDIIGFLKSDKLK